MHVPSHDTLSIRARMCMPPHLRAGSSTVDQVVVGVGDPKGGGGAVRRSREEMTFRMKESDLDRHLHHLHHCVCVGGGGTAGLDVDIPAFWTDAEHLKVFPATR